MSSQVSEEVVLKALSRVIDPDLHRDIVSLGMVKNLRLEDGEVWFDYELTTPACPLKEKMRSMAEEALHGVPGLKAFHINMTARVRAAIGLPQREPIPGVANVIAVGAGKGGVGKSTVSANLAVALGMLGAKVGLMDADVYGPNMPIMMGVDEPPVLTDDKKMVPLESHGVKVMSMGFLLDPEQPVIWRGPMLHSAMTNFVRDVVWGELDYLVVDLPPGTGDISLSLSQLVPISGAVVVTTPQEVSLSDVAKAVTMFRKLQVPVLGVVENMSYFVCPHCNQRTEIFDHGGGRRLSQEMDIPFLAEIPIHAGVRQAGDSGMPVVKRSPGSMQAEAFMELARNLAQQVSMAAMR
ncbi:MAG TPA: Mrp/NBP35 family ATP-binding protein [Candidatus Saccharimonadales bacterium]|nr:Mrp/NBP35 family ATP-binding protein [Candidatus Saccharimonadales bacterium]